MASNAAEISQAAAETIDVVADRLQQLDASTSGTECVLFCFACRNSQFCIKNGVWHRLTLDEKYQLCRSIGAECIQDEELRNLLEKKPNPVAYDGFEPSGRMHIAQVYCRSTSHVASV